MRGPELSRVEREWQPESGEPSGTAARNVAARREVGAPQSEQARSLFDRSGALQVLDPQHAQQSAELTVAVVLDLDPAFPALAVVEGDAGAEFLLQTIFEGRDIRVAGGTGRGTR